MFAARYRSTARRRHHPSATAATAADAPLHRPHRSAAVGECCPSLRPGRDAYALEDASAAMHCVEAKASAHLLDGRFSSSTPLKDSFFQVDTDPRDGAVELWELPVVVSKVLSGTELPLRTRRQLVVKYVNC